MNEQRKIIFRAGSTEIVLPVTPSSFRVSKGIKVETVNIHGLGDVRVAGYASLDNISIESFFPAQSYSFAVATYKDPYVLAAQFETWSHERTVVRFIVSGTTINIPVLIETISFGEQDGSNDVYYTLNLSEYRYTTVKTTYSRTVETAPAVPDEIVVEKHDCATNLKRKYTGNGENATKKILRGGVMKRVALTDYSLN